MSKQAIHHDVIKRHNLTQVFLEIQRSQELVKSDLVKHVHLSFAAVSAICDNLERNSLISIGGEANSTGGRRPKKIILALPGRRWEDREIERKMISSGNERNIREIL
jgi:hypothetical protein